MIILPRRHEDTKGLFLALLRVFAAHKKNVDQVLIGTAGRSRKEREFAPHRGNTIPKNPPSWEKW